MARLKLPKHIQSVTPKKTIESHTESNDFNNQDENKEEECLEEESTVSPMVISSDEYDDLFGDSDDCNDVMRQQCFFFSFYLLSFYLIKTILLDIGCSIKFANFWLS